MAVSDLQALYEKDPKTHVAKITMSRPGRRNALTLEMYEQISAHLNDAAEDDSIKVVVLRGADGDFTSGQDFGEAYDWYLTPGDKRRPSQRRRLWVDRRTMGFYHQLLHHNKVTVAQVEGYALGGGLEFLLSCDLTVVADNAVIGAPGTRALGPVLGNIQLFFHRLGPVLARDLLLTGRLRPAKDVAHLGLFTAFVPLDRLQEETDELVGMVAAMPADGIAVAKEAYRIADQVMGLGLSDITSSLFHAFGTNLRFEDDEFNFVKTRAKVGVTEALHERDRHFDSAALGQNGEP